MYWYNTVSLHTFAAWQFFFLMHCSEFFTFKNLRVLCVSEQTNKQTNITELILFKTWNTNRSEERMKEDSGRLQVVTGEKWKQAEGFKPALTNQNVYDMQRRQKIQIVVI